MRVVLDTNVIISGLLWGGSPNQLLRWARNGVLEVLCSEEGIAEIKRVIEYPKFLHRISALESSSRQIVAYLMNMVTHVPSPERISAVISEDPSDDLFLALAVENRARLLVSGDQHLLALKEYKRLSIVTPGEAVGVVKKLLGQ